MPKGWNRITDREMVNHLSFLGREVEIVVYLFVIKRANAGYHQLAYQVRLHFAAVAGICGLPRISACVRTADCLSAGCHRRLGLTFQPRRRNSLVMRGRP
jgi:hypothetical protein